MQTLTWHKFYPDKFMSTMHKHPNYILGMWMRVFCTMAESKDRWTVSGTLDEWARILGETPKEAKRFINFVIDNIVNTKVTIAVVKGQPIYTMTETLYKLRNEDINYGEYSPNVKQSIKFNRERMMNRIIEAYHPAKLVGKNHSFKRAYIKLMQDTSRGLKKFSDRVEVENDQGEEILEHIAYLKTTPEWNSPELLRSLSQYIINREWTRQFLTVQAKREINQMKTIIMNDR